MVYSNFNINFLIMKINKKYRGKIMTLIIDPQTGGIAGNMIIGALVDLGANPKELKEIMESVTPNLEK